MGRIKLFLIFLPALLIFILSGCEKADNSSTYGDINSSCYYSTKSEIYKPSAAADAKRRTMVVVTVKFFEDTVLGTGEEIAAYQVQVNEGDYIVLPDIRANYCAHGQSGMILTGWDNTFWKSRPGQKYEVYSTYNTFTAVWQPGNEIYTASELNNMRDNLTKDHKLMRDIDLSSSPYSNWLPIGDESNPFTGKFYGNGYRIDNLTIDNTTGSTAGLFGAIGATGIMGDMSEVFDLTIILSADGIKLYGDDVDKAAGALAGYIVLNSPDDNVHIENVETSGGGIQVGNFTCSIYNSNMSAGGLIGDVKVSASFTPFPILKIAEISNNVDVSTHPTSVASDCFAYLGGIIGSSTMAYPALIDINISENHGNITSAMLKNVNIGGILGYSSSAGDTYLYNCVNDGEIKAFSSTSSIDDAKINVGGIAGYIYSTGNASLYDCTNDGKIKAGSSSLESAEGTTVNVGGIVGATNAEVSRCTNQNTHDNLDAVSISFSINDPNYVSNDPYFYAGGIAGSLDGPGKITQSRNLAGIRAESTGNGGSYILSVSAGGLCGYSYMYGSPAVIEKSYNNGEVYASIDDNTLGEIKAYAGGLIGNVDYGTEISDSYNIGNVTANTDDLSSSSTDHTARAGGIVGEINGYSNFIKHTYNNGEVHASAAGSGGLSAHAGGIAGYMNVNPQILSSVQLNGTITSTHDRGWIAGQRNTAFLSGISLYDTPGTSGAYDGTYKPGPYTQYNYEVDPAFDLYFNITTGLDPAYIWTFITNPPTLQWEY
jgi:hypothetical protein